LFGNIDAPTVLGYPLSRYYTLYDPGPVSAILGEPVMRNMR
jgi:hypothetical protein